VLEIKKILTTSNIQTAKERVFEKLEFYAKATNSIANAMLAQSLSEQRDKNISEWIRSQSEPHIKPKSADHVGDSGQWFLERPEYMNWVGQGPSTLVCTGQRMCLFVNTLIYSWSWKNSYHVPYSSS